MITRVKEILIAPKKEWAVIEGEHTPLIIKTLLNI